MTLDAGSRVWHLDVDVAPEELPVHYKVRPSLAVSDCMPIVYL